MPSSGNLIYDLGMAAMNGDLSMVQSLLAAGVEMDVQIPVMELMMMMTPLHLAVCNKHVRSGTYGM